MLVNKALISSF